MLLPLRLLILRCDLHCALHANRETHSSEGGHAAAPTESKATKQRLMLAKKKPPRCEEMTAATEAEKTTPRQAAKMWLASPVTQKKARATPHTVT